MNKQNLTLSLITGVDILLDFIPLTIHQPTLKEIAMIGENRFFNGVSILTTTKERVKAQLENTELDSITTFDILLTILEEDTSHKIKQLLINILTIFFPQCSVMFTPQSILLTLKKTINDNEENNSYIVDGNNFEELQKIISIICNIEEIKEDNFNPANKKAEEIANKLKRARERVAAQKSEKNSSILSQYLSSISVGLHLPLIAISDFTLCQLYDIVERYSLYINWDLDVRTRLAGGKPDSQPENWMKPIH